MTKSLTAICSVPRTSGMRIIFLSCLAIIGIYACASGGDDSVHVQFGLINGIDEVGTVRDLRFYVSDVELLDEAGRAYPVSLRSDDQWQSDRVALIDMVGENSNTSISGNVADDAFPGAELSGIRFTLGVPFELNHANPMTAAAPLNRGDLFWSWQSGYKFLRVDLADTAHEWSFHLGSTGCVSASALRAPESPCAQPNRVRVELRGFDPTREPVLVRADELFRSMHAPGSATCTGSYAHDRACADVYSKTGLRSLDGQCETGCSSQRLFSAPEERDVE
jgi:uncharacterized repeat protein (TIGR04052 family)